MERIVSYQYTELIQAGFDLIPQAIADRLRYVHFFTGTDPIWAGLFNWEDTDDNRSFRDTWCSCKPSSLDKLPKYLQTPTIIMPTPQMEGYPYRLLPALVVHELGHQLDDILGNQLLVTPVTYYAMRDREEAFAEAFTCWLFPRYGQYYDIIDRIDDKTMALFTQLIRN